MYSHTKLAEKVSFETHLALMLINYIYPTHHQPTNKAELGFTFSLNSG